MLGLYNTMTRNVDEFTPLADNKVGLYTCGLTVYNYAHIGNLRTYIFEDILKRTLLRCGYEVNHVMNITDVGHLTSDADTGEDKMEAGARREGKSAWEIAEFFQGQFVKDLDRLNILQPVTWCKATDNIQEQIDQISKLEEKGFTYTVGDGVYFDTSKLSDYGKLARLDIKGLRAGARIQLVEGKRNLTDFALWKFSPEGSNRQMEWPSPWGVGFPGWHIECSTMAIKYLGERLDIHCGGIDHVPVHHTNEIAQAEVALGHKWVNWWMHGEFLTFGGTDEGDQEKMSKSSGGFIKLDTLIERGIDPLAYRYFCMSAHYRQQLAFTWEALDGSASAYRKLTRAALDLKAGYTGNEQPIVAYLQQFDEAIKDDLNMPRALAAMWGAVKDDSAKPGEVYATLLEMDEVLGLGIADVTEEELEISQVQIAQLIAQRSEARKAKDFARSDQIRDELASMGITLEDKPEGTIWRRS